MKQLFSFLLAVGLCTPLFSQDFWYAVDSMNGPAKSVTSSFVLNNNGYVVGGLTDISFTRRMYSYDPNQDDWDDELSWGGETGSGQNRGSAASFAINNIAYVGLGQGNTAGFYKDMWSYDPSTQTWTQLADFIGSARRNTVSFNLHDKGYIGLGQDETGLKKDFYRFDPTLNLWTQLNDFGGSARKNAIGCSIGDLAFVGTGNDGVCKNDFWEYDELSDYWIPRAPMPIIGREGAVAWGNFPSVFISCGENALGDYLNDLWEYNRYSNLWVQRASLPGPPRKHATAFTIAGIGYVGTGYRNSTFYDDFYAYSPLLGLSEQDDLSFEMFPNPTMDFIEVKTIQNISGARISSVSGQVWSLDPSVSKWDISEFPAGTYFLELTFSNHRSRQLPFIKSE